MRDAVAAEKFAREEALLRQREDFEAGASARSR
jgi:hypothetical protein